MANKQLHILSSRSRSPIFLFIICIFAFSLLFLLFSISIRQPSASPYPNTNSLNPETSFVASLEHFLNHKYPISSSTSTSVPTVSEEDVSRFDDNVFFKESERFYREPYYPLDLPIRVYVYEMPKKFTYDLLWLFRNTYRVTDNLTSNGSPVHRLIEQHSVDYWLWADLIAPESERLLKSVVRVERQEDADLFYVPFFTTISFFLLEKQQCKALYRVKL